jgi:hypothetical protein
MQMKTPKRRAALEALDKAIKVIIKREKIIIKDKSE